MSTFHFIDNLSRAIRHGGRILLDLIPKVYTTERVLRVLGEDMTPSTVQVAPTGQPVQEQPDEAGAIQAIYDLTAGKYDLTVKAGPSFTSRREEARLEMKEMMQGAPEIMTVIGDLYAKNLDWPGADEIAERLKRMVPPQALGERGPQIPPEVEQQMQQGMAMIQQLQGENQALKADQQGKAAEFQLKARELELKEQELQVKMIEAETRRIVAEQPTYVKPIPTQQ